MKIRGIGAIFILLSGVLWPIAGEAAVAPVGQLPPVTVSVTPSVYALPILLVEDSGEWKDFGIHISLKVHSSGEEQLSGLPGNEWDVGTMDPYYALKGGNDGDLVIVGLAGNYAAQLRSGFHPPMPASAPASQAFASLVSDPQKTFLPACLVASSIYADTRKTLVIRWVEGYFRGIRMIEKDPAKAASRLNAFYREKLNRDIPADQLSEELRQAFIFEEGKRDEVFRARVEETGMTSFARAMTEYQLKTKAIEARREPKEFILAGVGEEVARLRTEAEAQLKKTRSAIDDARKDGAAIRDFQKKWEEARRQLEEGRGSLTVIGVLSDLQRGAEQTRVTRGRLGDFRKIEMGIGVILVLYYGGYFLRRRKSKSGV